MAQLDKLIIDDYLRLRKDYEELKAKNSQIIECECGSKYTFCNKIRHLQTKKHIDYIALLK